MALLRTFNPVKRGFDSHRPHQQGVRVMISCLAVIILGAIGCTLAFLAGQDAPDGLERVEGGYTMKHKSKI